MTRKPLFDPNRSLWASHARELGLENSANDNSPAEEFDSSERRFVNSLSLAPLPPLPRQRISLAKRWSISLTWSTGLATACAAAVAVAVITNWPHKSEEIPQFSSKG